MIVSTTTIDKPAMISNRLIIFPHINYRKWKK